MNNTPTENSMEHLSAPQPVLEPDKPSELKIEAAANQEIQAVPANIQQADFLNKYPFARNYHSQKSARKSFPSMRFYKDVVSVVYNAWKLTKKGEFDDDAFSAASTRIGKSLENLGGTIVIEGYENINLNPEPCVFVANHMSTLETFFLPGIIQPTRPVTYVIKRSLSTFPMLGTVLQGLNAMVVAQKNPREDLVNILRLGEEQLKLGCSVIIFPQGTRTLEVEPEKFSSLAVKLAKRAGVRMIPIALKTDAWGMSFIKDLGFSRPEKIVHFKFGAPLDITGNGKEQHAESLRFIKENCDRWRLEDARTKQLAQ